MGGEGIAETRLDLVNVERHHSICVADMLAGSVSMNVSMAYIDM